MPRGVKKGSPAFIRGVCQAFLRGLENGDAVENKDVFGILHEEAEKMGYMLQAHQRGIFGTYVCFVKKLG